MNLEQIGEGRTTKVYRDGERAIKLYINAPPDEAANEAKKQSAAYGAGLPVPKVYGVRDLAEGVALDMAYIPGPTLGSVIASDKAARIQTLEAFVKLHCRVHQADGCGLPEQADALAWKIGRAPCLEQGVKDALLQRLKVLNSGKGCLCHGDFHLLNILRDGESLWIIDWVDATCGDPLADACRTYLIFLQYLTRYAGVYLRLYCKEARARREDVLAWLPLVAAGRLSENLSEKERAFLQKLALEIG